MRLRYVSVTYSFGGAAQSLERHFRELREELLRQGHHYGLLQPTTQWRPPVDIHETTTAILVKLELAGVREEATEITLYENALVVTGRRDDDDMEHEGDVCYHEAQVHYGPFRAEILLPSPVRPDDVTATFDSGFLRIHLPKVVASDPHGERPDDAEARPGASGSFSRLNAAPARPVAPGAYE